MNEPDRRSLAHKFIGIGRRQNVEENPLSEMDFQVDPSDTFEKRAFGGMPSALRYAGLGKRKVNTAMKYAGLGKRNDLDDPDSSSDRENGNEVKRDIEKIFRRKRDLSGEEYSLEDQWQNDDDDDDDDVTKRLSTSKQNVGAGMRFAGLGKRGVGAGMKYAGLGKRGVGAGMKYAGIGKRGVGAGMRFAGIGKRGVAAGMRYAGLGKRKLNVRSRVDAGMRYMGIGKRN